MLKKRWLNCVLIFLIFAFLTSCITTRIVVADAEPEKLPQMLENITPDPDSFINEFNYLIDDMRWRILYCTIELINGNITPEAFNEKVKPYYLKIEKYNNKLDEYIESMKED